MQSTRREDLSFLEAAARMLEERGGYRTEVWRLNAPAFGVPPDRMRCFRVASRLKGMPAGPPEEYQDNRRHDLDLDALPPVNLVEAIFDLSERGAGKRVLVERRDSPDPSIDPQFRRCHARFPIPRPIPLRPRHPKTFVEVVRAGLATVPFPTVA
jgi:DNA (cytosine-5)-methyltransferase 1